MEQKRKDPDPVGVKQSALEMPAPDRWPPLPHLETTLYIAKMVEAERSRPLREGEPRTFTG